MRFHHTGDEEATEAARTLTIERWVGGVDVHRGTIARDDASAEIKAGLDLVRVLRTIGHQNGIGTAEAERLPEGGSEAALMEYEAPKSRVIRATKKPGSRSRCAVNGPETAEAR